MTSLVDLATEQAALAANPETAIPPRDPDLAYSGQGPVGVWGDLWNTVLQRADRVRRDVEGIAGKIGPAITTEIQTYVGYTLQVLSTQINNLHEQLWEGLYYLYDALDSAFVPLENELALISTQTGRLVGNDYELREQIIPALLQELETLRRRFDQERLVTEGELQDWTRSNVTIPLMQWMQQLDDQQRQAAVVLAQQQFHYTDDQVREEEWQRVAALLLVQIQLNVIEKEFDECVNDMCKTMGPSTDLGKFLKALNFAATAALLAELASLDADGIESLLSGLVHIAGGVIDDIGSIFSGGESVGEALGGIIGI